MRGVSRILTPALPEEVRAAPLDRRRERWNELPAVTADQADAWIEAGRRM